MQKTNHYTDSRFLSRYSPANWENDIEDVMLESCDKAEDPSGFRVVFYRQDAHGITEGSSEAYRMGASYLKTRLKKLSRAGFDAPMTKKAIELINQKRFVHVA